MIDSQYNNNIIRRRMGVLNGKKLDIKPKRFGKGNYLRKFSIATSLHGVIYLNEPKRPLLERIFWICVISLVFLMCGYQIRQLFNNWMESHITSILSKSDRYSEDLDFHMPFPGITICSDSQLQNLEYISIKNKTEYEYVINLLCEIDDEPTLNISKNHFINPKTWDILLNDHRVFCEQRIVSVSWSQEKIDIPCEYFQPIYTIYGICYSINMVPFNQLLNNGYNQMLSNLNHNKADIIKKSNKSIWNPENGFSTDAKPFHLPWKLIGDTIEDSVTITFSLKKDNLGKYCPKTKTGMTLFLHSPIDVAINMPPTAYISINNIAYITSEFTVTTTSESISSWSPKIRHCYYQHERTLKFFKIYTTNNCEIECRANNSLNMCGCVAFYHPRDSKTPICSSASNSCLQQSLNNGYSILNKNVNILNTTNGCNCLDVCVEIIYKHKVVYMKNKLLKNGINPNKPNQDISVIVMYYKPDVWNVERTALISVNELLGNIGGSLGLFLGASIISVFEIIYFFVIRLYVDRWNKKKGKKSINIRNKY